MTQLQATSIGLAIAGRPILAGIDLSATSGAFIGIIGPNGAGKSSLLQILAGLRAPSTGAVTLNGRALHHWPLRDLAITRAYLPQHPACDWPISVERLVALGLIPTLPASRTLPPTHAKIIETTLQDFDLRAQRHQPVPTLSGGENARAMLARAMIAAPALLIVDEPFAGLDPRHAIAAATRLSAYAAAGHLVIAALHELDLALAHTTHLLALRHGSTQAYGPTRQTLTPALIECLFDIRATLHATEHGPLIQMRL